MRSLLNSASHVPGRSHLPLLAQQHLVELGQAFGLHLVLTLAPEDIDGDIGCIKESRPTIGSKIRMRRREEMSDDFVVQLEAAPDQFLNGTSSRTPLRAPQTSTSIDMEDGNSPNSAEFELLCARCPADLLFGM